ncbi:uncharacterized protein LOC130212125 [Pseudoliparis swirei]|uniref:uncharacterized protein LOC130212125 n=1 Tax=Pseudoliparis swirei TaxID=2059687 RepID=UPI0024BD6EC1|nr:uncharacterized protein LOC130212125 [Pseudoliparis swirei]
MPGLLFLAALLCCVKDASGDGPVAIRAWAWVGEAVILPCRISVTGREDVPSLEWSKRNLTPNVCFLYRDGCETFEEKNPVFRFRTGLFMEELQDGNASLRLSDVRLTDAGTYECKRLLQGARWLVATVELFVGAVSEPKLSVVPGVAVTVQCDAGCWFPLPVVTIEDARGNAVAGAEESKNVTDSVSGCVSVTRRATVQTDKVVCRVHQSETNRTKLAEIYIPGAVSEPKLSVVPGVAVTVQCDAGCWSPLPVVTIEDARGNAVAGAQESKNVEDSVSGCVSVTRRATVQTDKVVCRVHQSETNRTRLAEIYIPEECTTSCIPMILLASFIAFLVPGPGCAYLLWKKYKAEGERKSLPTESSDRNSTSSHAEGQNPISQTDPVQNVIGELRIEVADKDETIQRLLEELRSKQSPVECQLGQLMYPSQDVSNPTNLTPEPLPRDVDPKPGAATDAIRPKSGNLSQNKDSKPNISIQMPAPGPPVQRGDDPDHLMHRSAASPAAVPALPAEGWSVRLLRSKSDSLSRSNAAKAKPKNKLSPWPTNRFNPLVDLTEEKERLLFQQLQKDKIDLGDGPVAIRAWVGEAVILPCRINVTGHEDVPSFEWSKRNLTPNISFVYRDGCETFEEKNPVFRFRTGLFMEELQDGNASLRLSDVRLTDAGTYECKRLLQGARRLVATVELFVGAVSEPKLSVVPSMAGTVQCDAGCWFPLPVVTIEDARGNAIAGAEESKHFEDSVSGCVSVTRRATVQTDKVVCRVHQSETNRTRLAEIYIPEECMTSCISKIFVASFIAFLVPSAGFAFLLWKKCKSEGEHKSLPTESSDGNSTSSHAEDQNPISQTDPIQNGIGELKSSLRDKVETIQRLREEFRSKQSPVECQLGQPMYPSQDVSNPTNLTPEPLPRDVDPKPGAATDAIRPKSGNLSQNKDSKPNISIQMPAPGPSVQRGDVPDHLMHSGAASPAAVPASLAAVPASPTATPALPAEGWSVRHSRRKYDSLPRSNAAKAKPKNNLSWPTNRFSPLEDLSEEEERLLSQQKQKE